MYTHTGIEAPRPTRRKRGISNRTETITLRVSPWEKQILQMQARYMGMSLGAYLVFSAMPPSEEKHKSYNY